MHGSVLVSCGGSSNEAATDDKGIVEGSNKPSPGQGSYGTLSEKLSNASATSQLSGGQRQRIALAHTAAKSPKPFLMNEPLSAPDANPRTQICSEMIRLYNILDGPGYDARTCRLSSGPRYLCFFIPMTMDDDRQFTRFHRSQSILNLILSTLGAVPCLHSSNPLKPLKKRNSSQTLYPPVENQCIIGLNCATKCDCMAGGSLWWKIKFLALSGKRAGNWKPFALDLAPAL